MELYFIRHGSTDLNEKKVLRGWLDPDLSELGVSQGQLLADYFADEEISKIYSSNLRRALDTAKMIGDAAGMPFEETGSLRPINFGELQGKPLAEINDELARIMKAWQFDPNIKSHGGESFKAFQDRTYNFINDVIADAEEEDCILMITHVRVCLYVSQLVSNEFKKLVGKDLDRLDTVDVMPGNFIKIERQHKDDIFRLSGVNQLEQDGEESEKSEVTSAAGT